VEVHVSMLASVRLNERSSAAGAITSWRDRVYLAWTGTDLCLNMASSPDGREFVDKQRLAEHSYKQVRKSSSGSDESTTETIALPPSVTGCGERLYLAWTGTDRALNVLAVRPSPNATKVTLKQRSSESPSLIASPRASLVLAWTGTDRHVNLLSMADGWSGGPVRLPAAKTGAAPAVCSHNGSLIVAWTGSDRRVNLLTAADGWSGAPVRLEDAKTDHAPAVCSHNGSLVLAWIGTDYRLNLGYVP